MNETTTTTTSTTTTTTVAAPPTTESTVTTTTTAPRIGDGRTISPETAQQADQCLDGWQSMRSTAAATGRLERDEFERTEAACDRAIELLGLDRADEATSAGPTAQLNFLLLLLRLQWIGTGVQFATVCPADPGAPCALTADDLGGSFDFLVIAEPSPIVPDAFVGELDRRLDVSAIAGLRVD